ncbi:MAG TPA: prolyl-tRNA synthetase associated domain-containing protein [Gemmatimonadaceae bacterium]
MTADIYAVLQSLGIEYERYDHDAVFTCDEAERAVPDTGAVHTKNLFVRDKRGRRHLLVITTCSKTADLKRLAGLVDADNLSFASPERLDRYLGVSKGSVTILGLVNDAEHAVELVIDADVWRAPRIHAHPLVNTATLVLRHEDVARFLEHTGHQPRVVEL